jgi:hypothetical protein
MICFTPLFSFHRPSERVCQKEKEKRKSTFPEHFSAESPLATNIAHPKQRL